MPEALTVDAAVAALDAAPEPAPEEQQPEAQVETPAAEVPAEEAEPEIEAAPEAEEPDAPEEASVEAEAEEVAPALPASDAPRTWDTAAKEHFATLPRAIQDIVLDRADQDARAVSKALQEANDARKATEADSAKVTRLADELTAFLPQALKTFEAKWGQKPDWAALVQQVGSDEALKIKFEYEQEQQQLGELVRKENEARSLAHQDFVKRENAKLAELSPEMSHPETGSKLRGEVASYAIAQGAVTAQELANVSAAQLSIAHKAMLYDRLPEALKNPATPPAPKPAAQQQRPPARPAVRPSAAPAPTSQTRTAQQAANRFAQTNSIDDAVAMLDARRK